MTLDTIDERIKQLDEFNGLFKDFDAVVKEFEAWLGVGRLVVVETKWFKDYGKQLFRIREGYKIHRMFILKSLVALLVHFKPLPKIRKKVYFHEL